MRIGAGKVARNGRQDWRRVISFVSDSTTAAGGCIFVVVGDGGCDAVRATAAIFLLFIRSRGGLSS